MSAGQRLRTYDTATIQRWADAIQSGISAAEFRARFNIGLPGARRAADKLGLPLPRVADAGFGGEATRKAKAPPAWRWKT